MARLGDFIGTVLVDVAQARVRTDIEALRIAETYVSHDLLKHMPVPRFRMPEINLDVPVIIASNQATAPDRPPPLFEQPHNTEITKIVRRSLLDSTIRLPYNERRKVYYAAHKKIRDLFTKGPAVLLDSNRITRELNTTVKERVRRILEAKQQDTAVVDRLSTPLARQLKDLLLAKLMQTERLQVKVASADIKEYGDPENLVKIRISISEDSFEIVAEDKEQIETYRLVPE